MLGLLEFEMFQKGPNALRSMSQEEEGHTWHVGG